MGLLKKILFLAAVALVAWLFFFNGVNELNKIARGTPASLAPNEPASVQRFEKEYGTQMLSYTDPYYGFSIKYPVGYSIELAPELGVQLRITAFTTSSAETIEVRTGSESAEEAYLANAAGFAPPQSELKREGTRNQNGKTVYYINGVLNPSVLENAVTERMFVRQGFFDCTTPEGEHYAAAVTAIIPESLSKEIELADYAINTFTCP